MIIDIPSTKRPIASRLIIVLLLVVPLVLCLGAALWAEFAPHYIPLERVNLFDASEWSSVTMNSIMRNDNRFSVWSGEATICASHPDLCQGSSLADITQQLSNWFTQQGWKIAQRNPATSWNSCDNLAIVQRQGDLVFEQQSGIYYKPTICVSVETNSATSVGFTIHTITINPSPLTSWSD